MIMEISFPGGMGVDSHFKGHTIHTDQPTLAGGQDSGPAPFDLFLASIGTCAGFYAARFCEQRQIPTDDLKVTLEPIRDQKMQRIGKIHIGIQLPADFPEKYRAAVVRAVDQCAVKRHILEPPEFEVVTS